MTDPDAPESTESDLVGIKGWLLFYVISSIFGVLLSVSDPTIWSGIAGPAERYFVGLTVTIQAIGVYLIFYVRKPLTRSYHIWLNLIYAGFIAFGIVGLDWPWPQGWGTVLAFLIWASYWIGSKRVRATYCQAINRAHNS